MSPALNHGWQSMQSWKPMRKRSTSQARFYGHTTIARWRYLVTVLVSNSLYNQILLSNGILSLASLLYLLSRGVGWRAHGTLLLCLVIVNSIRSARAGMCEESRCHYLVRMSVWNALALELYSPCLILYRLGRTTLGLFFGRSKRCHGCTNVTRSEETDLCARA